MLQHHHWSADCLSDCEYERAVFMFESTSSKSNQGMCMQSPVELAPDQLLQSGFALETGFAEQLEAEHERW